MALFFHALATLTNQMNQYEVAMLKADRSGGVKFKVNARNYEDAKNKAQRRYKDRRVISIHQVETNA